MSYPKSTWRFLNTGIGAGAWNMAVDEALLESIGQGQSQPVLRVYAWEPACLSLGYAQPCADADLPRLASFGWDLVRRPTGGRAILHTDELTYSVIGPAEEPRLAGSVLESYRRLSEALLAALHDLEIPAQSQAKLTQSNNKAAGAVCFETPSDYEITVDGKKLIGSAQARRKEGVLQHGSLPLDGDLSRITQALAFPDEEARRQAAERLLARATTVEASVGRRISWDQAVEAFQSAFRSTLNLDLLPDELTPIERERAQALVQEKYNNPAWTQKL
jgi:lipoate-protein ligase A